MPESSRAEFSLYNMTYAQGVSGDGSVIAGHGEVSGTGEGVGQASSGDRGEEETCGGEHRDIRRQPRPDRSKREHDPAALGLPFVEPAAAAPAAGTIGVACPMPTPRAPSVAAAPGEPPSVHTPG